MTRTITITSGKGGVGKTIISVNMALYLASLGYRTCLFDADLGLANVNILLQLYPEHSLEDVIQRNYSLNDILIRNYMGIDIIPGSTGVEKMANLEPSQADHLIRSFSELDEYDFLLFDTSAGVSKNVLAFCLASSEIILIITPEPTSLTDAYSLLKILTQNQFNGTVKMVLNQCHNISAAKWAYAKFKETVQKYLHLELIPLGIVPQDPKVVEAIKTQQALILLFPESRASKCLRHTVDNLLKHQPVNLEPVSMTSFWAKCLQLIKSPLNLAAPKKDGETQKTKARDVPQREIRNIRDASVKIRESLAPKNGADLSHTIPLLLNNLIEGISSISHELQLIRKSLQEAGHNLLCIDRLESGERKAMSQDSVILDYDNFLKQRGIEIRKEGNG